jgi:hypothetical protein
MELVERGDRRHRLVDGEVLGGASTEAVAEGVEWVGFELGGMAFVISAVLDGDVLGVRPPPPGETGEKGPEEAS